MDEIICSSSAFKERGVNGSIPRIKHGWPGCVEAKSEGQRRLIVRDSFRRTLDRACYHKVLIGFQRDKTDTALNLFVQKMEKLKESAAKIDGFFRAKKIDLAFGEHQAVNEGRQPIHMVRMDVSHKYGLYVSRLNIQLLYLLNDTARTVNQDVIGGVFYQKRCIVSLHSGNRPASAQKTNFCHLFIKPFIDEFTLLINMFTSPRGISKPI